MNRLGQHSALHFIDLNQNEAPGNRNHAAQIRSCGEAERSLRFIEEEVKRFGIPYAQSCSIEQFFDLTKVVQKSLNKSDNMILDDYVAELNERETFLKDQAKKFQEMQDRKLFLVEHSKVLDKTAEIMEKGLIAQQPASETLLGPAGMRFASLSGVINTSDTERLKKLVFRVSRGNFIINHKATHS